MEMVNGQLNLELKIKDEKLALSLAEQFVSNKRALMDAWTKALSKN